MSDKRGNIVMSFALVYVIMLLLSFVIVGKVIYMQFVEKEKILEMADKYKKTDILVDANRGNIYACDGRLLASSIPTYHIYMDMGASGLRENNLFGNNIDSLSYCLAKYFGEKSQKEYKEMLLKAYRAKKRSFRLFPNRITYAQLKVLRKFPLFRLGRNKSGLITKELLRREKPFGSLASRTIGDVYSESKEGRSGLEMFFNEMLKGIPGLSSRQKVANRWSQIVEVEPVDGMDLKTTIDVDLQDVAERVLVDSITSYDAEAATVVMMEVKTGEIKVIVNMQKNKDGTYSESRNGAVSDLSEPGSTFKVASLMVLLDNDKAKITDTIRTGNGIRRFADRNMTDHNHNTGGFGTITLAESIHGSSNIGISTAVVKAYGNNPSAFVEAIHRMKWSEKLELEIPGTAKPNIRSPKDKSVEWTATTLPWMSIGYETQIPPIYTLNFYNAIANEGKLIKPFLVKAILKHGQVYKEFKTEVLNEKICKTSTLRTIQETLLGVIEGKKGTAKNMKSKHVRIAGKTGTALLSKGGKGYKQEGKQYIVSFCGYFPAEKPLYTAIVVIREPKRGHVSGGGMAGSVFKSIAERTMALKSNLVPTDFAKDTTITFPYFPNLKYGNNQSIQTVLGYLKLPFDQKNETWVKTTTHDKGIQLERLNLQENKVPNLIGMGAKDAIYLATRVGLRVYLKGKGKVVTQTMNAGAPVHKGKLIVLQLK